ncbi:hypothetical protein MVEN_01729100 [Mycena venus]|uniref:Uncharacterized protein n=1 Tax=Mycena venus TaxID=2733690 RepID=A0A8H6XJZ4_9AGAR|nr:hypothetical protein MVEN_01729100 [Mycena venus]
MQSNQSGAYSHATPILSPAAMEAATMSTSADTIRTLHARLSPTHSPFQSPPDSPSLSASGSSVSSFPSVSSSFFFSSAAASPPHEPAPPPVEETLIIPSLTLPALLISPKQPKGPLIRLLVLGPSDAAAAALFVDNPDALDPNAWVYEDGFRVLRTSTEWREPRVDVDAHAIDDTPGYDLSNSHGTERCNVELVALGEDIHQLDVSAIEQRILDPFRSISALLAPPLLSSSHEEELLTALLAGPEVPLYTALLVVPPSLPIPTRSPHPPSLSETSSASGSTPASASATLDSTTLPSIAPTPNSSSNASVSVPYNSADANTDIDIDTIPETLRRLVPVIVLAPDPAASAHDTHSGSSSDTNADADAGDDEGNPIADDTTIDIDLPSVSSLTPRSAHAPGTRTASAPRPPTRTRATWPPRAAPTLHTRRTPPPSLRRALRSSRALRADAAACFVRWWRAGGVDPYTGAGAELDGRVRGPAPAHAAYGVSEPQADPAPASPQHLHGPPIRLAVHMRGRGLPEKAPLPLALAGAGHLHPGSKPPLGYARAPYAYHDPLHLPSILLLARDVVRASWAGAGAKKGEGQGGGWRWGPRVRGGGCCLGWG